MILPISTAGQFLSFRVSGYDMSGMLQRKERT